jgi:hypothetical protein
MYFAEVTGLDGEYICHSISSSFCSAPKTSPLDTTTLFPKPKPSDAHSRVPKGEREARQSPAHVGHASGSTVLGRRRGELLVESLVPRQQSECRCFTGSGSPVCVRLRLVQV